MRVVALSLVAVGAWFARADWLVPILDASQDAVRPARGVSLSFVRSYAISTNSYCEKGLLGYGWADNLTACFRREGPDVLAFPDAPGRERLFVEVKCKWRPADPKDVTELTETTAAYVLKYGNGVTRSFSKENMRTSFVQDNQGNSLTFTWNGNELFHVAHNDGQSLTFSFANGLMASIVDDCGRKTEFRYDNDFLTEVKTFDGRTTRYEYRAKDNTAASCALAKIARPDGTWRSFEYDGQGRVSSVSDGAADKTVIRKTTITRSDDGVAVIVAPDGGRSVIKFGNGGEVLQTTDALGNARRYSYTTNGMLESVTAPSGNTVSVEHDDRGRIAALVAASGARTKFAYAESFGGLACVTDANGQDLSYGYDSCGRATVVTFPDGSSSRLSYNVRGDVAESRNRRAQAIARVCDAQGRVIRMTWPDGRIFKYAYDARGNLVMAQDSETGAVMMSYDRNDRMTRIAYPGNRGLEFAYDSLGRLIERKLFGGDNESAAAVERFAYDAEGRLASLSDGDGKSYLVNECDARTGRLATQTYGNDTVVSNAYDSLGRIAGIYHGKAGLRKSPYLAFFEYTYDVDGRCIASRSQEGWETYAYDADGQLTSAFYPGGTKGSFLYDAVGNRKTAEGALYTVNSLNQYTKISQLRASEAPREEQLSYDLDGNIVLQKGEKGETRYFYDVLNRLVAVTNEATGVRWSCKYDALGNRVSVTDNDVTTERVFIPGALPSVVAEFANGKLVKRRILAGAVNIAEIDDDGAARYFHGDIIGSVRLVTDGKGGELSRASYSTFGALREGHAPAQHQSPGYVGMLGVETDPTGLLFMRNRYYSSDLGRFITPDPTGLAGGDVNWYRYCGNAPIINVDVDGFDSFGQNMAKMTAGSGLVIGGVLSGMSTTVTGPLGVAGAIEGIGGGGILIYDGLRDIIRQDPVLSKVAEHLGGYVKDVAVNTVKSAWNSAKNLFRDKNAIPESSFVQDLNDAEIDDFERIRIDEDGKAHYEESFSSANSFAPDPETKIPKAKKGKQSTRQRNLPRSNRNQWSAKDSEVDKDDDELSPDQIPDPDNDNYVWCEDVCGEEGLRPVCPVDTAHCIYWGCSRCGHVIRKKARKAKRQERIWKSQGIEGVWHGTQLDVRQAKAAE